MLLLGVATAIGQAMPAFAATTYTYQCRDGGELVLTEGYRMAYVQLDGKQLSLPQRRIAFPGSKRYSQSGISITTKGRTAIVKRGSAKTECEAVRTY